MNEVELKVSKRQTGKQISKKFRKEGKVPGIFYMPDYTAVSGKPKAAINIPILSDTRSLRDIIYTKETKIVNLEIEGDSEIRESVLKDVTFDPVTDSITHFDLLGIKRGYKLRVEVPIVLKGQAIGAKDGGVVQQLVFKVPIHVLPKNLPNAMDIDISKLKIGKSIMLKDLEVPDVEYDMNLDTVIVTILPPRVTQKGPETPQQQPQPQQPQPQQPQQKQEKKQKKQKQK